MPFEILEVIPILTHGVRAIVPERIFATIGSETRTWLVWHQSVREL